LTEQKDLKRKAYIAIMLMGVVSMLGDIVYESGRGIAPDYLYFLGASAFLVGLTSGIGELVGYGVRLISGPLADRSHAYWLFIFLGYSLILTIPLMGLTNSIWLIIAFVIAERLGKALRSPSRDAVVSVVSKGMGSGKAFGLRVHRPNRSRRGPRFPRVHDDLDSEQLQPLTPVTFSLLHPDDGCPLSNLP
jgi:MFS family permease